MFASFEGVALTVFAHLLRDHFLDFVLLLPIGVASRLVCGRNPNARLRSDFTVARILDRHHFLLDSIPFLLARLEVRFLRLLRHTQLGATGLLLKRIDGQTVLGVFVGRLVRHIVLCITGGANGTTQFLRLLRFVQAVHALRSLAGDDFFER